MASQKTEPPDGPRAANTNEGSTSYTLPHSLCSCSTAFIVVGRRRCRRPWKVRWIHVVGAAARSWVDRGRPFVQWGMLSFVRNVAIGAVLCQTLSTRFQSECRLSEAVRVWTLPRSTWAGHLWGLEQRAEVMHALAACRAWLPLALPGLGYVLT